jgi:hypothetical protein
LAATLANRRQRGQSLPGAVIEWLHLTISDNSALWHLARTLWGIQQARVNRLVDARVDFSKLEYTEVPLRSDYDTLAANPARQYALRLEALFQRTARMGAKPIVVTQPGRWYRLAAGRVQGTTQLMSYEGVAINGVDHYYLERKLDSAAIAVCRKDSVMCIDLGGEDMWEDGDFYDQVHNTPKGAQKVGDYLFEKLSDLF